MTTTATEADLSVCATSHRDVFSSPFRSQLSARVSFVLFTVYYQRGLIFYNGRVAFRHNKLDNSSGRSAISH